MAKESNKDLDQKFGDMLPPIFKLQGLAELFRTDVHDEDLILSEKARNGIFMTLSEISDELQIIKNEGEESRLKK